MTLLNFFGCLLIAYGPPVVIFLAHVAQAPELVILIISSAFFWLLSILLTSVWWIIIPPMKEIPAFIIPFSVALQEVFRFLFFLVMVKAEGGLNMVAKRPNSRFNRVSHSFVSGLGFGLMSSLISFIRVLVESIGPGYLPCESCPRVSLYFISALTALLFTFLHVGWMMLAFEGFRTKSWTRIVWVIASHLASSYITMLNGSSVPHGCAANLLLNLGILAFTIAWVATDIKRLNSSV